MFVHTTFIMNAVLSTVILSVCICSEIHMNFITTKTSRNKTIKFYPPARNYSKGPYASMKDIDSIYSNNKSLLDVVLGKNKEDTICTLKLKKSSINKFRHFVYYQEANFVFLDLVQSSGANIKGSKLIVGENIWVWTFYGKEGGLEILNWPIEFRIWSLGLLSNYVISDPMKMVLEPVSGNCSNLQVGQTESDYAISNALSKLTVEMLDFSQKYGPSFYCYKSRVYIEPHFIYMLCKHIICPIEAVKYSCNHYYYNTTLQKRIVSYTEEEFRYDPVNWVLPTLVSIILFGFCPVFILYILHALADEGRGHLKGVIQNVEQFTGENTISTMDRLVLLDDNHHVTLLKTLCLPMKTCGTIMYTKVSNSFQIILKRFWRIFLPCLSLGFIGLQVLLDYFYLNSYVSTSVQKGVPMGFRSMLAGYKESKINFMPYLGGPFVAVGAYVLITCVLLVIPNSVSDFLLKGLQHNYSDETYSPLCLQLRSIEMYGSFSIRRRHGYFKIYSVLLAQFFMLINIKFWKHVLNVQYDRWKTWFSSKVCLPLIPVFAMVCIIEIVLCIALYGYPINSFALIIIKAYCGRLWATVGNGKISSRIVIFLLSIILIISVTYFLFMFATIFFDACLFITRVVVFTFTGIVVYPKVSYGYLIFTFTVIYYIWQSIQEFSFVYQRLLKDTVITCEALQRANDTEKLVVKSGDYKAIKESLFEHVIENHSPRRMQVFLSVLKVGVIITILGLSINTLAETDGFRELHVVMHVGTALFVCALPQIMKSMCRRYGEKFKQKRFRKELAGTIVRYTGYCSTETEETDSD
ncbi:uncharacterized protein LOC132752661 isoform X2 [Ruditapes philippinarum]|uniref:uncharacterized protein LOC132752661 isoform X2 n=1 Tax=Ruditapes philippinarum TaxID=129788 RepID=UPI00295B899D|nr:uncharacterized protein LOC132752661 isoform X2 [Ruditapes philippinarum]